MSYVRNVVAMSVVLAVACGGSASTNNLTPADGGGTGTDGSASSSGAGSTSSSGSSGGTSSGTGDDSGLTEVDDSGYILIPGGDDSGEDDASSSGGSSSGASSGAGMDATIGVTTPPRGTDGGANQIECGATPCDSTTQVCCASAITGRSCVAIGACTDGDSLACSGTNSCPTGDVCCEDLSEGGRTIRTSCRAACGLSPQLCTTDTDCTKAGQYCHKYGSYGVCERAAALTRDL
jgi:hypothetical protein